MRKSKDRECSNQYCNESPYLGGRCRKHSEEHQRKAKEESDAIHLLHHGKIDNEIISNPELQTEYLKLANFWRDVCSSANFQKDYGAVPLCDSDFAVSWCEIIAKEVIRDERQYRKNGNISRSRGYECIHSWEKICELLDANTEKY